MAAIEIVRDRTLVYEAVAGSLESFLGLRLKVDASLSGLALERSEAYLCSDSDVDTRVDREACRRVGARSLLCAPLLHIGAPSGILKLVHHLPHYFQKRDFLLVQMVANALAARLAHKLMMAALRMSESKFRSLFEGVFGGVVLSRDGLILDANDKFCTMVGCDRREITGLPSSAFVHADSRDKVQAYVNAGQFETYEMRLLRRDGTSFLAEGCGRSLMVEEQNLRVSTIREITGREPG